MSLSNFWSVQQKQIIMPSLDVDNLEIDNVPFTGGGGGSQNLQQVLSVNNNGGGLDAVNIGNLKCTKYLEVGNAMTNTAQIHLCWDTGTTLTGNNYQIITSTNGLCIQQYRDNALVGNCLQIMPNGSVTLGYTGSACISNGTTSGTIFDTQFNYPYLSSIISKNNNCLAGSLTNLNSVQINNKINLGSGNQYCIQLDNSNNLNINNLATNKQLQLMANGDVILSASGNVYVSNGSSSGRVFDSAFNLPPITKVVGFGNQNSINTQQVGTDAVSISWGQLDTTQQIGTVNITTGGINSIFTCNNTIPTSFNFSGYMTFSNTGTTGDSVALYAVLNNGANQATQSRVWYDNTIINEGFPSISFSFNVVLQPGDCITLFAWSDSTNAIYINGQESPFTCRLIIVQNN